MEPTPFTVDDLPPLGSSVRIALSTEKPTGEKFTKGEPATVAEHTLTTDGRVTVGVRTADGRILRSLVREAFIAPL